MTEIEVISVGTEVVIDGEIPATVKRVCIEDEAGCLTYECVWWDERARKSDWFRPHEVTAKDVTKKLRITMK
jgi:uncharacterized protein YodC (DUF2158 family)